MIIDNHGDSMIRFRLRQKEYSRVDDIVLKDQSISKLVKKLDSNNVFNYGLSVSIPDDVISINYGSNKRCSINIPLDLNQFQYDIEDYFIDSKPRIKFSSLNSRNSIRYFIKDLMDESSVYNLILYIIDKIGYVVICPELKR
jgi:hypothetical protein